MMFNYLPCPRYLEEGDLCLLSLLECLPFLRVPNTILGPELDDFVAIMLHL